MNDDIEKRKAQAKLEVEQLMNWSIAEAKKVSEQLTREGAVRGLDGHQERYAYIREIRNRRLKEIAEKYDLPHNLK